MKKTREQQVLDLKLEIIECVQRAFKATSDWKKSLAFGDSLINARIKSHPEVKDLVLEAAESVRANLTEAFAREKEPTCPVDSQPGSQ